MVIQSLQTDHFVHVNPEYLIFHYSRQDWPSHINPFRLSDSCFEPDQGDPFDPATIDLESDVPASSPGKLSSQATDSVMNMHIPPARKLW